MTTSTTTAGTVARVVKLHLDGAALSAEQRTLLDRHAGTARAVYNWALARINAHEDAVRAHVHTLAEAAAAAADTTPETLLADDTWRKTAYTEARTTLGRRPSGRALGVEFTRETHDPDSRFHWWKTEQHGVNRFAVSSALDNLQQAIQRGTDPTARRPRPRRPRADGRPAGWPRFKSKHRTVDSFAIFNVALIDPWRPIEDGHRLRIPSLGSLRVQENTRQLRRMIQRGGHPKSARFTRTTRGNWTIVIVVAFPDHAAAVTPPPRPNRRQRRGGPIGVDLGVTAMAALSDGTLIPNPRHGFAEATELKRLRRRLDRQHRAGSPECFDEAGRHRRGPCPWHGTKTAPASMSRSAETTLRQIGRLEQAIADHRATTAHQLTKRLATGHELVAIEDLNTAGMTARPAARPDAAGNGWLVNGRRAKAGLNRSILRVAFGEIRRQLTYKTRWYGADLVVIDRWAPTSKTCSRCGAVKPKLSLAERTFMCGDCGLSIDRDINAARNILRTAQRAAESGPDRQSTNGRGPRRIDQSDSPPRRRRGVTAAREGPPIPPTS